MIFGLANMGNTNQSVDRCVAAGIHLARGPEFNTTGWSVQALENVVLYAAQRQVKLILLMNDGNHSSRGFMALGNIVAMIQRVGPAGTLWSGGNAQYQQWAPTHIECGNEWAYSYRFAGGNQTLNAQGVAGTVRRFYDAVGPTLGANAMKFICEGEDASSGTSEFLNALVAAQPNIRNMVDGWTIHGYGPQVQETPQHWGYPNYQRLHDRLNARGWTTDKIWITENGIASDNGSTMLVSGNPNNYGYKHNCTYQEAADRILAIVRRHGNTAPWAYRVAAYLYYQPIDQRAPGVTSDREHYFGAYKIDGSPKGPITSAMITLKNEFPYEDTGGPPPPTASPLPASSLTSVYGTGGVTHSWGLPADTNRTGIRISRKPSVWNPGEGPSAGTVVFTSDAVSTGPASGSVLEPFSTPGNWFYRIFTVGPGGTTAGPTANITISTGPPPVVPDAVLHFDFPFTGSNGAAIPSGLTTRKTNTASAAPTLDGSNHLVMTTVAPDAAGSWQIVEKTVPVRFDDPDVRCFLWTLNDTGDGASWLYLASTPLTSPNPFNATGDLLRVGVTATLLQIQTRTGGVTSTLHSGAAPAQDVYNSFAMEIGASGLKLKVNNAYVVGSLAAGVAHGLTFAPTAYVVLESFNVNSGVTHVSKFGRIRMFQSAPSAPVAVSVVPGTTSTVYDGQVAPEDEGIERYLWLADGLTSGQLPTPSTSPDQVGPVLPPGTWSLVPYTENQSPFGV